MNSILGACVGDAAGATLEFYHGPISEEVALKSMRMPGGGSLGVGPGQITDDGELTITLWQALKSNNPADGFPYKSANKFFEANGGTNEGNCSGNVGCE